MVELHRKFKDRLPISSHSQPKSCKHISNFRRVFWNTGYLRSSRPIPLYCAPWPVKMNPRPSFLLDRTGFDERIPMSRSSEKNLTTANDFQAKELRRAAKVYANFSIYSSVSIKPRDRAPRYLAYASRIREIPPSSAADQTRTLGHERSRSCVTICLLVCALLALTSPLIFSSDLLIFIPLVWTSSSSS